MVTNLCVVLQPFEHWQKYMYEIKLPMIGLSPTLPGCLAVIPPVEVANATLPSLSKAQAPTVSWPLPSFLKRVSMIHKMEHKTPQYTAETHTIQTDNLSNEGMRDRRLSWTELVLLPDLLAGVLWQTRSFVKLPDSE